MHFPACPALTPSPARHYTLLLSSHDSLCSSCEYDVVNKATMAPSFSLAFLAGFITCLLMVWVAQRSLPSWPPTVILREGEVLVARHRDLTSRLTSHEGARIEKWLHFERGHFVLKEEENTMKTGLPGAAEAEGLRNGVLNQGPGLLSWSEGEFAPLGSTGSHVHHDVVEIFHVKRGRCRVMVENLGQDPPQELLLDTGDSFAVLPGTHHDVQNPSETEILVMVYAMVRF